MNPYDEIAYPSHVYPQSHPDCLATHALLRGLDPAPPASCRVLELGCNDGTNLIAIATVCPGVEAVGVDLAEAPVAAGNALAREVGVRSVRLVVGDASRPDPSWGTFDYVIAHGLYSWVPAPVRDGVLETIRQVLRPSGVAFVSYAALPGSYVRQMFREMMLLYSQNAPNADERLRRSLQLLRVIGAVASSGEQPREAWLRAEVEGRLKSPPSVLRHDDLSESYAPAWFHEFAAHAASHGLRYLGEAEWVENSDLRLPPDVRRALASVEDRVAREQVRDLLTVRRFRQTLLVHAHLEPKPVRAEALERMFVSAKVALDPAAPAIGRLELETFAAERGGRATTNSRAARAAVHVLVERWPERVQFADLVAEACARVAAACGGVLPKEDGAAAVSEFLHGLHDGGIAEFHLLPLRCAKAPGPRPEAGRLARRTADRGEYVISMLPEMIHMEDARSRKLITLLDGTRDRAQILDALRRAEAPPNEPPPGALPLTEELLDATLRNLATQGVLVA